MDSYKCFAYISRHSWHLRKCNKQFQKQCEGVLDPVSPDTPVDPNLSVQCSMCCLSFCGQALRTHLFSAHGVRDHTRVKIADPSACAALGILQLVLVFSDMCYILPKFVHYIMILSQILRRLSSSGSSPKPLCMTKS